MLNFTVGPVMSKDNILAIGAEQVPYFRTPEFSKIMLENEALIKKFIKADQSSRAVFITGSGTASMEAVIMNCLTKDDKAIIVNGGSFGQRFVNLCRIHEIPFSEIKIEAGKALTADMLQSFDGKNYTTFIVNEHETSTGVLYDMDLIGHFCKKNNLFLIVDAISSFLADDCNMQKHSVDVMITGSQKALACPPGVSVIVLSHKAINRTMSNNPKCMYFDLKDALKNGERGQTPFTPAVGIMLQINARLKEIDRSGGVESEKAKIAKVAEDFRSKIKELPFEIVSDSLSNSVTPLHPTTALAHDIFITLKDEYDIWICPSGGVLKDTVFRVGHIGALSVKDNDKLIEALNDMKKRGLI